MQFERIKKNHKRKIIIGGLILVCITSVITITTTRAKYKLTEEIEIAKGTINYKPYDFKIMAMYKSEDKTNYTEINEMPSEGYIINESKSYCNMSNGNKDTTAILKTINGNHTIGKLKKNDRCYLYFDKKTPENIQEIIAIVNPKDTTPTFSNIATTDEGVYKVSDGVYGGYSYYWRGAVTNNYVKFGGFCWRIIRINGDGSMRLIYDGTTCHANGTSTAESIAKTSIAYNTSYNQSNYVGWTYSGTSQRTTSGTASNAKTQLESWYSSNLASHASKIADGKYCNDRNVGAKYSGWSGTWATTWSATGTQFAYAGVDRLWNKYQPTLSCPSGDVYTLKVGLITADEVEFAGGKNENNTSYYLYNGQNYWTISPGRWDGTNSDAVVFRVDSNGNLYYYYVSSTGPGLRPVINLKADTEFQAGGNGTQSNPYVVQ